MTIPMIITGSMVKFYLAQLYHPIITLIVIMLNMILVPFFVPYFCILYFKRILVTAEGLFIATRLIGWVDIRTIEDNKYTIKITTKVKYFKKQDFFKNFYTITPDDVIQLKRIFIQSTEGNAL